MILRASQLSAGMKLLPTGRIVERVVHDGVFLRSASDERTTQRWTDRRKVEVKVDGVVRYWNRATRVQVEDQA